MFWDTLLWINKVFPDSFIFVKCSEHFFLFVYQCFTSVQVGGIILVTLYLSLPWRIRVLAGYWDEISSLKHLWCLLYNGSLRSTYLLFAKFSKNLFSIFIYFGWLCLRCFICCSFVSPPALLSIYCCHSNFSVLRSDNSVFYSCFNTDL